MAETHLLPRDPQAVIIGILRPAMVATWPAVKVGATLPDPIPTRCATVRSDGGPMVDQVQTVARIGVNLWAPSEADAFDMAAVTEKALLGSVDGLVVLGMTSVSGPVPIGEASQPAKRIYMTFEAVLAGSTG